MPDNPIKLIVVDASPLISLAAAESLDYLLYPELPVVIPDAVFYEATASTGKLGAQEIIRWHDLNRDKVAVEPTRVFQNEIMIRLHPDYQRTRDVGERAAVEVISESSLLQDGDKAILLADDKDVRFIIPRDPEKIILMTTWEFLKELESDQRIQSAEYIFERIRKTGRNPPSHDIFANHAPEIREAVKGILTASFKKMPKKSAQEN